MEDQDDSTKEKENVDLKTSEVDLKERKSDLRISLKDKILLAFKSVTIEPIVLIHLTAILMTYITTIDLILERACLINKNFTQEICEALANRNNSPIFDQADDEVQKVTASITIWRSAIESSIPVIFVLFLGSWTDIYGRKLPMMMSMCGYILQLLGLILCTQFEGWNAQIIAVFAAVPVSLTGSQTAFNMCLYAYIADTSSLETRTIRTGFANACWFLGISLGLGLGGVLFESLGYIGIFSVALGLEVICLLGVGIFIKNTKSKDVKVEEISAGTSNGSKVGAIFNLRNLLDAIKTVFRKRENSGRLKLGLLLLALICTMGPIQGETNVIYLFVRKQINWKSGDYGIYGTYKTLVGAFGTVLSLGVFSYWLKFSDPSVGIISGLSQFLACFVYAFAKSSLVMYIAPVVDLMNGTMMIVARAMISKMSGENEQGKVQSFVASMDSLIPVVINPIYGAVYRATLEVFAGTFFLLSAGLSVPPLIIFGLFYWKNWTPSISDGSLSKKKLPTEI